MGRTLLREFYGQQLWSEVNGAANRRQHWLILMAWPCVNIPLSYPDAPRSKDL